MASITQSELTINSHNLTVFTEKGSYQVIVGKLINVIDSEKDGYLTRRVVILTEDQYPQIIFIDFKANNVDKIKWIFEIGWERNDIIIQIKFNIQGVEYNDKTTGELKYFNNYNGWDIRVVAKLERYADPIDLTKNLAKVDEVFEEFRQMKSDLYFGEDIENNFVNLMIFLNQDNYFRYLTGIKSIIDNDLYVGNKGVNLIFYTNDCFHQNKIKTELLSMVLPEFEKYKDVVKIDTTLVYQKSDKFPTYHLLDFLVKNEMLEVENNFIDVENKYLLAAWNFIDVKNEL